MYVYSLMCTNSNHRTVVGPSASSASDVLPERKTPNFKSKSSRETKQEREHASASNVKRSVSQPADAILDSFVVRVRLLCVCRQSVGRYGETSFRRPAMGWKLPIQLEWIWGDALKRETLIKSTFLCFHSGCCILPFSFSGVDLLGQ